MGRDRDPLAETLDTRYRYVECLRDGPRRKPELCDRLGDARSTVDYAIRDLLEVGAVERGENGFRLTALGRLAGESFESYLSRLDDIQSVSEVLTALPNGTVVDPAVVAGAEAVVATEVAPNRPLRAVAESIRAADTVRRVAPTITRTHLDALAATVDDGGCVELVVTEEVLGHLVRDHDELATRLADTDDATLYRTEREPPVEVVWCDGGDGAHCTLVAYDDSAVVGCVRNDSETALAWASEYVREWRDEAVACQSDTVL
jgi:predicted transcriptional regulator